MPSLSKNQLALIGGALVVVILVVAAFMYGVQPSKQTPNVNLTVWGTDPSGAFSPLVQAYMKLRTNVRVQYTYVDPASYKTKLLDALAAGQGPDVFFVRSHNLPLSLLVPAPDTQMTLKQIQDLFPKVVEQDFAPNGKVNALPLYIDTLALIYNRDIFDRVGVVTPPATWDDFQNLVKDLRVLNNQGQIQKSGAAIGGTTKSIYNAPDILEMLFLQNFQTNDPVSSMIDSQSGRAIFASGNGSANSSQAFSFYTQFADSGSPYFTWDDLNKNSIQNFASGDTVMLLDYNEEVQALKAKNPYLQIGIAPAPQVSANLPVTFAEYDGLAVSKQSKNSAWAWDFVVQSTTNETLSSAYLTAASRPPALRTLIGRTLNNAEFGVFAKQALTARSWYYADHDKIGNIFDSAIAKVISGGANSGTALTQAESQITAILNPSAQ